MSLIPSGDHMMEEENQLPQAVFWPPNMSCDINIPTYTYKWMDGYMDDGWHEWIFKSWVWWHLPVILVTSWVILLRRQRQENQRMFMASLVYIVKFQANQGNTTRPYLKETKRQCDDIIKGPRLDDHKLEASLGYMVRPCLRKQNFKRKKISERKKGKKRESNHWRDSHTYLYSQEDKWSDNTDFQVSHSENDIQLFLGENKKATFYIHLNISNVDRTLNYTLQNKTQLSWKYFSSKHTKCSRDGLVA